MSKIHFMDAHSLMACLPLKRYTNHTYKPEDVTCKTCRNTKVWKAAIEKLGVRCESCKLKKEDCYSLVGVCDKNRGYNKWQPIPPTPEVEKACPTCINSIENNYYGGPCHNTECYFKYHMWQPIPPAKVIEFKSVFAEPPMCCSCELPIVGPYVENTIGNIICEPCLIAGMKALREEK